MGTYVLGKFKYFLDDDVVPERHSFIKITICQRVHQKSPSSSSCHNSMICTKNSVHGMHDVLAKTASSMHL